MRKLLRQIARAKMQKQGIQHMNKPVFVLNKTTGLMEKHKSYFAEHWRDYANG